MKDLFAVGIGMMEWKLLVVEFHLLLGHFVLMGLVCFVIFVRILICVQVLETEYVLIALNSLKCILTMPLRFQFLLFVVFLSILKHVLLILFTTLNRMPFSHTFLGSFPQFPNLFMSINSWGMSTLSFHVILPEFIIP